MAYNVPFDTLSFEQYLGLTGVIIDLNIVLFNKDIYECDKKDYFIAYHRHHWSG